MHFLPFWGQTKCLTIADCLSSSSLPDDLMDDLDTDKRNKDFNSKGQWMRVAQTS